MTWSPPDGFEALSSQTRAHCKCYERAIIRVVKDKIINEAEKIFSSKEFQEAELPYEVAEEAAAAVGSCHGWPEVLFEDCVGDVSCDPEKLRVWITKTVWCMVGRMDIYQEMQTSGLTKAQEYPGNVGNGCDTMAVELLLGQRQRVLMLNATVVDACGELFGLLYVGEAEVGEDGEEDAEDEDDIEGGSDNSGLLDESSEEDQDEEEEGESVCSSEEEEEFNAEEGGEEAKQPFKIRKMR